MLVGFEKETRWPNMERGDLDTESAGPVFEPTSVALYASARHLHFTFSTG